MKSQIIVPVIIVSIFILLLVFLSCQKHHVTIPAISDVQVEAAKQVSPEIKQKLKIEELPKVMLEKTQDQEQIQKDINNPEIQKMIPRIESGIKMLYESFDSQIKDFRGSQLAQLDLEQVRAICRDKFKREFLDWSKYWRIKLEKCGCLNPEQIFSLCLQKIDKEREEKNKIIKLMNQMREIEKEQPLPLYWSSGKNAKE